MPCAVVLQTISSEFRSIICQLQDESSGVIYALRFESIYTLWYFARFDKNNDNVLIFIQHLNTHWKFSVQLNTPTDQ